MSGAPADLDAIAATLDEVAHLLAVSARWQWCLRALPFDCPMNLHRQIVGIAVTADDAAREASNRLRLLLGLPELPDPADPPPARPDEA